MSHKISFFSLNLPNFLNANMIFKRNSSVGRTLTNKYLNKRNELQMKKTRLKGQGEHIRKGLKKTT